jgi:hypothetical protein
VSPKQVSPKQVSPKQVSPKQVSPKQVSPEANQAAGGLEGSNAWLGQPMEQVGVIELR